MKAGDFMEEKLLKRRILIIALVVALLVAIAVVSFFLIRNALYPCYVITLDANGGTVSQTQIELRYNRAYTLPTPHLQGFSFYCWTYNGEYVPLAGIWDKEGDMTLTAQWEYRDTNGVVYSKNESGFVVQTVRGQSYTSITIPKEFQGYAVTGIMEGAFDNLNINSSTTHFPIYVPSTVTQIGENVFNNEKLELKYYDNFHETEEFTYLEYNNELEILSCKSNYESDLIIPEKYNDIPITKIGKYAFMGAEGKINQSTNTFYRILIPTTVKLIDKGAFMNCGGIKCSLYYYNQDGAMRELTKLETIIEWLDSCTIKEDNNHLADVISLLRAAIGWSKYSAARIYVKLDTDGGILYDANGNAVYNHSQEMKIGNSYALYTPVKEGYTFEGWFLDGERVELTGERWKISSHVTLVAKWTEQ